MVSSIEPSAEAAAEIRDMVTAGSILDGPNDARPAVGSTDLGLELGLDDISFDIGVSFDDFTSFMDSVPIPGHEFSSSYQPIAAWFPDRLEAPVIGEDHTETLPDTEWPAQSIPRASNPDSSLALSTYGSRLPSLQPEDRPSSLPKTPRHSCHGQGNDRFSISEQDREGMLRELAIFSSSMPDDFVLPSKHAISRFISAYFNFFSDHHPFLHTATIRVGAMRIELILAIAAVGARYSREPDTSNRLYHLSKDITLERFRNRRERPQDVTSSDREEISNRHITSTDDGPCLSTSVTSDNNGRFATIETMQAMALLLAMGTWFKRLPDMYEALSIRSMLDSLLREDSLQYERIPPPHNWLDWVRYESIKRLKFVSFCFFNMHTVAFDMPPMMLPDDLRLDLPCAEHQWKATNEHEWFPLPSADDIVGPPEEDFNAVFERLFEPPPATTTTPSSSTLAPMQENASATPRPTRGFSSLGGCVLMHAIIQRIWLVRNSGFHCRLQQQLSSENMKTFEHALKTWSLSWESGRESSMDPLSPHGPVSFTSTALLRLAYVRINMDLGSIRCLGSWNPNTIAQSLDKGPKAPRSHQLTRAALHCAHALSIPVKLGVNYVAQTQVVYWSVQHALCSLECAVLMAKWLDAVTVPNPDPPLNAAEIKVMHFVMQLVAEANHSGQIEKLAGKESYLSSSVVRLWASLYKAESVWEMINMIARSLNAFADLLEMRIRSAPTL